MFTHNTPNATPRSQNQPKATTKRQTCKGRNTIAVFRNVLHIDRNVLHIVLRNMHLSQ